MQVTLTAGQTFVQVVTTSTISYPVSFKAGSDQPPATPSPVRGLTVRVGFRSGRRMPASA